MTDTKTSTDPYVSFRNQLVQAGLLVSTGISGIFGHGRSFIETFDAVDRYITAAGEGAGPELYRFPAVMPRVDLARTDYLRSFPDLIGSIHSFAGGDAQHAEFLRTVDDKGDWAASLAPTELMMLPAACYPLYPMATGRLPEHGRLFDVMGTCFRHEPSVDLARMTAFHMREYVRIGTPEEASEFRAQWLERSPELMTDLGLDVRVELANDPFFGRVGKMLAANQREGAFKYEIVTTVANKDKPTPIASCNCHEDHLTIPFEIETIDGATAHSACAAFGMERIVLALYSAHGTDESKWPTEVRRRLWP